MILVGMSTLPVLHIYKYWVRLNKIEKEMLKAIHNFKHLNTKLGSTRIDVE